MTERTSHIISGSRALVGSSKRIALGDHKEEEVDEEQGGDTSCELNEGGCDCIADPVSRDPACHHHEAQTERYHCCHEDGLNGAQKTFKVVILPKNDQ